MQRFISINQKVQLLPAIDHKVAVRRDSAVVERKEGEWGGLGKAEFRRNFTVCFTVLLRTRARSYFNPELKSVSKTQTIFAGWY